MINVKLRLSLLCAVAAVFTMSCGPKVSEGDSIDVKSDVIVQAVAKEELCRYSANLNDDPNSVFIGVRGYTTHFCDDDKIKVSNEFAKIVNEKIALADEDKILLAFNVSTMNSLRTELIRLSYQNSAWLENSRRVYTTENEFSTIAESHDIMTSLFLGSEFYESFEDALSQYNLDLSFDAMEIVLMYPFDRDEDDCRSFLSDETCQYVEANDVEKLDVITNVMIAMDVSRVEP